MHSSIAEWASSRYACCSNHLQLMRLAWACCSWRNTSDLRSGWCSDIMALICQGLFECVRCLVRAGSAGSPVSAAPVLAKSVTLWAAGKSRKRPNNQLPWQGLVMKRPLEVLSISIADWIASSLADAIALVRRGRRQGNFSRVDRSLCKVDEYHEFRSAGV